MLIYIQTLFY